MNPAPLTSDGFEIADHSIIVSSHGEQVDILHEDDVIGAKTSFGKTRLPCQTLLSLHPTRVGTLYKRSNSWWCYWLPWFYPLWRERLVVLIGGFIYRYEHELSDSTKGIPIPVESISPRIILANTDEFHAKYYTAWGADTEVNPNGAILELVSLRKTYVFRLDSADEAREWASAINRRKQTVIKQKMGHAKAPQEIAAIDKVSSKMYDSKLHNEELERSRTTINPMAMGL